MKNAGVNTVAGQPPLTMERPLKPGLAASAAKLLRKSLAPGLVALMAVLNLWGAASTASAAPASLLLPQSAAFGILGHSCGGIRETAYATGFDATSGNPTGAVYLKTTCSTGGRGSRPATFTVWAAVTWNFGAGVVAASRLKTAPAVNATFSAKDAYGDQVYNTGTAAYLVVPVPAAPAGVTAAQAGDAFQVGWTPNAGNPAAITSSLVTATPVNSTAPVLTVSVSGPAAGASIGPLQPQTTYQISIVSNTLGGPGPASAIIQVTSAAASVAPSVPTSLTARWANLDPTGATDTLIATWVAAAPGNSPVDQYEITIRGSDGGSTLTQTVAGTTLAAIFAVDFTPNWSVTVRAHNAAGWGPASAAVTLGGL